ncbi:MAG TPA: thioredoxin domain-containing protein [Candidatus Angelobacter sp.]|nr:thioredoxin domain-containing protein [Candidatus Angelobacter sp.]
MKTFLRLSALALAVLPAFAAAQESKPAASSAPASAAPSSQTQKNIEAYLRNLYAFGPEVKLVVGPLKETPIDGLLETNIDVTIGDNKEAATFYVSKDGQFLFRGELSNLTRDPLAENRARMQLNDAPMLGDPKAPVTIVEYSDFECPVCRNLHDMLRSMLPNYAGKVRVVFKDFPIEQLHPWARTAAIAGRCAYRQSPAAFWKMYDYIYDNQDLISAATAWTKLTEYAGQAGLDTEVFKTCMASQEAAAAVNASHGNGELLEVTSTPTIFVNGRRMVGADQHLLEQYINYELAKQNPGKPAAEN